MTMASKSGSVKIKRKKEVFDLYKSGDSINSQNIILKFVIFTLVIFIILILFFKYYLLDKMTKQDSNIPKTNISKKIDIKPINTHKNVISSPAPLSAIPIQKEFKDNKFMIFKCSSTLCFFEDISIPKNLLLNFIKSSNLDVLYIYKSSKYMSFYYINASLDFYNFIYSKGVTENEILSKDASSFISNR